MTRRQVMRLFRFRVYRLVRFRTTANFRDNSGGHGLALWETRP